MIGGNSVVGGHYMRTNITLLLVLNLQTNPPTVGVTNLLHDIAAQSLVVVKGSWQPTRSFIIITP